MVFNKALAFKSIAAIFVLSNLGVGAYVTYDLLSNSSATETELEEVKDVKEDKPKVLEDAETKKRKEDLIRKRSKLERDILSFKNDLEWSLKYSSLQAHCENLRRQIREKEEELKKLVIE